MLLISGCGGDDGGSTASTAASNTTGSSTAADLALGQLFSSEPTYARAAAEQRLTWGLFDVQGAPLADAPDQLVFDVYFDGAVGVSTPLRESFGEPVTSPLRIEGLPRGYYALRVTPDREGLWSVRTEVDGQELTGAFQVGPQGGPGVIEVGTDMPTFETATVEDPLGVEPLCTNATQCPFHERSLSELLGSGPVAMSISTPAYCQVAICGPVLDLLVEVAPEFPDISFVHAEPYKAPEPGDPFAGGTIDALERLQLDFEPTLLLIGSDGVLVDRLDNIYDLAELREALASLA